MPLPILAAGELCGAMFVAGIVIAFFIWIIRMVAKSQETQAPPSVRPRRNDRERDRQRDEIEAFNREMSGRRVADEEFLEVVDENGGRRQRPQRRPPQNRPQRQGQRPAGQRPTAVPPPSQGTPRQRPGESIASRSSSQPSTLGSGVRSHLAEYMEGRIGQSVEQHLAGGVAQTVQQHLGAFTKGFIGAEGSTDHPIVRLLRDPAGVRTALILNEVLTRRPKRTR